MLALFVISRSSDVYSTHFGLFDARPIYLSAICRLWTLAWQDRTKSSKAKSPTLSLTLGFSLNLNWLYLELQVTWA